MYVIVKSLYVSIPVLFYIFMYILCVNAYIYRFFVCCAHAFPIINPGFILGINWMKSAPVRISSPIVQFYVLFFLCILITCTIKS